MSDRRPEDPADAIERLTMQRTHLIAYIRRTRAAIAAFAPSALAGERMSQAHMQISAVLEGTETAAEVIMQRAERCLAADEGETYQQYRERVSNACLEIIEACAFQDLTGQRINKVAAMLRTIEKRLSDLEASLGEKFGDGMIDLTINTVDDLLLQGPPLPNGGITQSDVDAIMKPKLASASR